MAEVLNADRLRRKIRAMPDKFKKAVLASQVQSAQELTSMQKRLAPQDKGALARSVRFEVDESLLRVTVIGGGTAATRREVRKGSGEFTDEAILTEFGAKAHKAGGKFKGAKIPAEPPRPWFFPAYRALKKRIKGRYSRAVNKAIKEIAGNP